MQKETIDKIVKRLKKSNQYKFLLNNIDYKFSEMEIVALRRVTSCWGLPSRNSRDYMLVFKVGSNYKERKEAIEQLNRHEKHFLKKDRFDGKRTADRFFKFFVYPADNTQDKYNYRVEWIRR